MSDEIVERFERIVSAALFSAAMVEDADVEAVRAALATAEAARPDEREAFEAWCAFDGVPNDSAPTWHRAMVLVRRLKHGA